MKGVAQELRLSSGAVWGWLNNAQVPQLENLLRICYLLDISLLRLLTDESVVDDIPKLKPRPLPSFLKRSRKRSPRPFDAQAVQHTLEAVLERGEDPPPPMRTVAKRLDYSHSFLHKRFPDLCRAISARYMTHQKKRGRQREQKLCEEIAQAVERLHAQDLYPSAYRIEPLLSEPGFMRHPTALAIWHQKLQELGWESKPGK